MVIDWHGDRRSGNSEKQRQASAAFLCFDGQLILPRAICCATATQWISDLRVFAGEMTVTLCQPLQVEAVGWLNAGAHTPAVSALTTSSAHVGSSFWTRFTRLLTSYRRINVGSNGFSMSQIASGFWNPGSSHRS